MELDSENTLRRSLAAVNQYAAEDPVTAKSDFAQHVKAEVNNIFVILRNKVNMVAYHDDIDTMTDMHHHIAQSAMNTPDLRLATLMTIQRFHARVRPRKTTSREKIARATTDLISCSIPGCHFFL